MNTVTTNAPVTEIVQDAIAQAPAAPVVDTAATPVVELAPEAQELKDAETAAALEASGKPAETTAAPVVEAPAQTATPAAPVQMVPMGALIKERSARQALDRKVAQLEGVAHAYKQMAERTTSEVVDATPQPTVEEQLAEISNKRIELATEFDNNKLTGAQWEKQRQELETQERKLREVKPAAAAPVTQQVQDDLALAQHAQKLAATHPVLRLVSDAQLKPLVDVVYAQAEAAGEAVPTGVLETTWLREKIAALAEQAYPTLAQQAKEQFGVTTAPVVTATAAPAAPTLSPTAQARDAKITLAGTHPVDVSKIGSPASGVGQSDAEIEARLAVATEDEAIALIESMPAFKARMFKHG